MIINIENVIPYLLDKNLLEVKSIIEGDLKVIDISRNNRNINVLRNHRKSYLLKQPSIYDSVETIQREANFYNFIKSDPHFKSLTNTFPHFINFDQENKILITEFINHAQSLTEYYSSQYGDGDQLDKRPAYSLGKIMAKYHHLFKDYITHPKLSFFCKSQPFIFFISRPSSKIFANISLANLKLIKIIQEYSKLSDYLNDMIKEWQILTLIHGDLRWNNVIISKKDRSRSLQTILVDWEFADIGDPAWDIGGVLNDFLSLWIFSLPYAIKGTSKIATNSSLKNIQPVIRAFWHAYSKATLLDYSMATDLLKRSMKYCAAQLVLRVYELHQWSRDLSNNAITMLQTSIKIFKNIDSAIYHLLGIPL
jgi:Phosphotransferase enzyme family